MFINHGTRIFDCVSGRIGRYAPERLGAVSIWNQAGGGLARLSAPGQPCCSDAGWGFRFPPLVPQSAANRATSREDPPEFPRAIISRLDKWAWKPWFQWLPGPLPRAGKQAAG